MTTRGLEDRPNEQPNKQPKEQPDSLVDNFVQGLAKDGLNMAAVLTTDTLPDGVINDFNLNTTDSSLLLIGNHGPSMWRQLQQRQQRLGRVFADPVDDYVQDIISERLRETLPHQHGSILYPRNRLDAHLPHVPLQQLGTLAGWHHTSPLGIGIHPEFGLWFAYRALVCIDCALSPATWADGQRSGIPKPANQLSSQLTEPTTHTSPSASLTICDSCQSRACQTACPAGAITFGQLPDMQLCSSYRLRENSPCANQCLARKACPAGEASRYDDAQTAHHYSLSLAGMRKRIQSDAKSV